MRKATAFGLRLAPALLAALVAQAQTDITFPLAVERALRSHAATTPPSDPSTILDALSVRTLPTVRAETSLSTAENLNLLFERVDRFDAFTAVVSVAYPLLDAGGERRRVEALRADARLLRRRAREEAGEVFRETLEAFAQLYLAGERLRLLEAAATRAAELRQRASARLESGEISNLTAAQWHDQALAAESQIVDIELQRLEAETRLRQLMGDTSSDTLRASLALDAESPVAEVRAEDIVEADAAIVRASLVQERQRLALQEATALRRPQLLFSAFGGVAAVPSTYETNAQEGTFGIYGLRLSLSLPMFDAAAARRVAEARLQLEEASRVRGVTEAATRNRIALLRLAADAAEKRIGLLTEAVRVARQREESVTRLVAAGVRPESDLVEAATAAARREGDLLAVRVDRWKLRQQALYLGSSGPKNLPPQTAAR